MAKQVASPSLAAGGLLALLGSCVEPEATPPPSWPEYASTVVEDLGLAPHGLVRAGCACYTTEEEVDRLLAGVAELL